MDTEMERSVEEPGIRASICEVLQILGAKWAFVVIAELHSGPKRFRQLQRSVAVINTQSLTNTLRHLESMGIVHRQVFPTVPVTVQYSLTEKGMDFQAALKEMDKWVRKWGNRHPMKPEEIGEQGLTQP